MRLMRPLHLAVLTTALFTVSVSLAHADSIPVSGTAIWGGDLQSFTGTGPSSSFCGGQPGGVSTALLWPAGTPFSVSTGIGASTLYASCAGSSFLGVVATAGTSGFLNFAGPDLVITGQPNQSFSITVPVTVNGVVIGWADQAPGSPASSLIQVFDFAIAGTGTLSFNGYISGPYDVATYFNFSFVGEATPLPEPSTLVLFPSGLAGLAWATRKRRKFSLP